MRPVDVRLPARQDLLFFPLTRWLRSGHSRADSFHAVWLSQNPLRTRLSPVRVQIYGAGVTRARLVECVVPARSRQREADFLPAAGAGSEIAMVLGSRSGTPEVLG